MKINMLPLGPQGKMEDVLSVKMKGISRLGHFKELKPGEKLDAVENLGACRL